MYSQLAATQKCGDTPLSVSGLSVMQDESYPEMRILGGTVEKLEDPPVQNFIMWGI